MNNLKKITNVSFPKYSGININMMPFILGDTNSIPEEYIGYEGIINSCKIPNSEIGKVGYLTITESFVNKDSSQRRGGIHVEKHASGSWGGGSSGWGGNTGLFMASNIDNSCMAWDYHVDFPGKMGDCEHLRGVLGDGILMKSGELFWMTDSCPHESLKIKEDTYRQFFRLVTSDVGLWYEQHSTKNPLGVEAPCLIIKENKFES